MQTFAPLNHPAECAACLDLKRLGKQIIECRQIGKAIANPGYGWQNHPATKMWRGHEAGLLVYNTYMNAEWEERRDKTHGAYKNMLDDYGVTYEYAQRLALRSDAIEELFPDWWGKWVVHRSHQSNLLRKDPEHYGEWFPGTPDDLDYVWPVR